MPTTFIVQRWNKPPLEFDGEIIAEQSSFERGKAFWQEIRIYRTTTNKFVTEVVRKTTVDDEPEIITVKVFTRPEDVRKGLFRKVEGRTFLTNLAADALAQAARIVPAIATIDPELHTERI